MPSRRHKHRELHVLFGMSDYGKSWLLNELLYNYDRVIILDPEAELDCEFKTDSLDALRHHVKGVPFYRALFTDPRQFEQLCKFVYNEQRDLKVMFAVDEIQKVLYKYNRLPEDFYNLVFAGRHREISLAVSTQRVKNLALDVRSQATHIYTFRQEAPEDIDWLKDVILDPRVEEVPTFPERRYLYKYKNQVSIHST